MEASKMKTSKIAFLCAAAIMLICTLNSCTRTVYVSEETGKEVQFTRPKSSVFCDMVKLDVDSVNSFHEIWMDRNTDVLYWVHHSGYQFGITPIMESDGTCLTYTEWKSNKSK